MIFIKLMKMTMIKVKAIITVIIIAVMRIVIVMKIVMKIMILKLLILIFTRLLPIIAVIIIIRTSKNETNKYISQRLNIREIKLGRMGKRTGAREVVFSYT